VTKYHEHFTGQEQELVQEELDWYNEGGQEEGGGAEEMPE